MAILRNKPFIWCNTGDSLFPFLRPPFLQPLAIPVTVYQMYHRWWQPGVWFSSLMFLVLNSFHTLPFPSLSLGFVYNSWARLHCCPVSVHSLGAERQGANKKPGGSKSPGFPCDTDSVPCQLFYLSSFLLPPLRISMLFPLSLWSGLMISLQLKLSVGNLTLMQPAC